MSVDCSTAEDFVGDSDANLKFEKDSTMIDSEKMDWNFAGRRQKASSQVVDAAGCYSRLENHDLSQR